MECVPFSVSEAPVINRISFKRDSLRECWDELLPLFKLHYEEIAHYKDIPLDPDSEMYFKLEDMGMFKTFTVRDQNMKIIGYAGYFIKHNIHYKTSLQATQDVLFIDPKNRGKGFKFISWCDEQLRNDGVQVVSHHVKAAHNFGKLLERIGYELQDLIFTRRLDRQMGDN